MVGGALALACCGPKPPMSPAGEPNVARRGQRAQLPHTGSHALLGDGIARGAGRLGSLPRSRERRICLRLCRPTGAATVWSGREPRR